MAYQLSGHLLKTQPSREALERIPEPVGWELFFHPGSGAYVLDTFPPAKRRVPLTMPLPAAGVSVELPAELAPLSELYEQLRSMRSANSFKRSYISFALWLSAATDASVLSFITDDDELDFVCEAFRGRLLRLRAICDPYRVGYSEGEVSIAPFDSEESGRQLHATSATEVCRFLNIAEAPFGLGSFDQPTSFGLQSLARSG